MLYPCRCFLVVVLLLQVSKGAAKLRKRSTEAAIDKLDKNVPTTEGLEETTRIAQCFGDCDSDDHCQPGLFCYHRDPDVHPEVPGCSVKDNVHLATTTSVCVSALPVGYSAERGLSTMRKRELNLCVGDCDNDEECGGNLVCFQRGIGDPIPQCPNKDLSTRRDYCVEPEPTKLGECGSDCNQDSDCQDELVCQQRSAGDPVPQGCNAVVNSNTDYCVRPNRLQECEGDCDSDRDCQGNLVCFQRDEGDPAPPGCSGINTDRRVDFCVRPNNIDNGRTAEQEDTNPAPAPSPPETPEPAPESPSFRLRLYWESGYDWQGVYRETFWCLTRDVEGDRCWHGLTRVDCSNLETYVTRCSDSNRQQWNFEYVNNDEALIRAAGTNWCLERSGWDIYMQFCDLSNSRQHFYAVRGGFDEYRFEIGQESKRGYCMSQDHHPKNNEYVQMFPCSWNRSSKSLTSYWERY